MADNTDEPLVNYQHDDPYQHTSKRLKLEEAFECVLLKTGVDSPSTTFNADNEDAKLLLEPADIKTEADLDYNAVPLVDFNVSNKSEVDPLLADSNMDQGNEIMCNTSSKQKTELAQLKCPDCDYSSPKKRALFLHQRTKHHKTTVSKTDELVTPHEGDVNLAELNNTGHNNETTANSEIKVKINMDGMNKVDNLLKNNFFRLTLEEQIEIKKLGPHRPTDIQIHQTDKKQNRFFSGKWFDKVEWLTVSEGKKSFFCFYCLLFGGDTTWSKTGYNNIKHLSEKIKLHESSSAHINNAVQFKMLGYLSTPLQISTDSKTFVWRHNEIVDENRHILSTVLDCIKFCVAHELQLYEADETTCTFNRRVFLGLVSEVANFDSILNKHIKGSGVSTTYTSEETHDELLECMYYVYQEELKKDIEKANYVSVQVEKVADGSIKPQFAIILRYMKDGIAVERLQSFIQVDDCTAAGLTSAIKEQLIPLNIRCKLIAQTYDGTVTMRGPYGGVQSCMRDFFPHALFVHSYSHSFCTIIKQACSTIKPIKIFFVNLSRFPSFFSIPSKRTELLQSESGKHPGMIENKWNSDSEIIRTVYHNQLALLTCCEAIKTDYGWDDKSIWEATWLTDLLTNRQFLFFAGFFYAILHHIDILYTAFKSRQSCGDIMTALQDFERTIVDMMESITEETKTPDSDFKTAANEACGIIISELRERFEDTDHLIAFSVIDPDEFRKMAKFPHDHLQVLTCRYRMLVQGKLTSEMKVFYNSEAFFGMKSPCAVLNLLAENELLGTFSELCKLIEIVLATPAAPTGAENCLSTSEKLKKFMTSDVGSDKLSVLATLVVHQDVIEKLPGFNSRVIEHFATKGSGRPQFLYKSF